MTEKAKQPLVRKRYQLRVVTDTEEHARTIQDAAFGRSRGKSVEVVAEEVKDRSPRDGWEWACALDYTVRGNSSLDIKRFGERAAAAAKVNADVTVSQLGSAVKLTDGGEVQVTPEPIDESAIAEGVEENPPPGASGTEAEPDPNAQHERADDGTIQVTPVPIVESASGGAEILEPASCAFEAPIEDVLSMVEDHDLAAMSQFGVGIDSAEPDLIVIYGVDAFGTAILLPMSKAFPADAGVVVFVKSWNERPREAAAWEGTD